MEFSLLAFVAAHTFALMYVIKRFGRRFTLTSALLVALVIVHGVPLLIYLYSTGPSGYSFIYSTVLARQNADEVENRLFWAIALAQLFIIAGSEWAAVIFASWRRHGISAKIASSGQNLISTYRLSSLAKNMLWMLVIGMLSFSIYESHFSRVYIYFSTGGSEFEKIAMRRELGGSEFYLYNVILYSIAPFLVMVTYFAERGNYKHRIFPFITIALFAVVLIGKLAILAKFPPVFFLLQLIFAYLLLRNQNVDIRHLLVGGLAVFLLSLLIVLITFQELDLDAAFEFLYYRLFDIPNEGLFEYFAAYPHSLPHNWGYGLFAKFFDADFVPAYFAVADISRQSLDSTSNSMFIADAWAEFSWFGVVSFSLICGFVLRAIDLYAFRNGFTDEYICLTAGAIFGVFTALATSLTTAMLTGGLLTLPLLSAIYSGYYRRNRGYKDYTHVA